MKLPTWAQKVGPGIITGASDDDPSGIATYSIAGASLGYGLLWVALITIPMMIAVQEMCARIGMVCGCGLIASMRRVMPVWLLRVLVALVVGANTLNIAADVAGMSSSAALVTPVPSGAWAVAFGALLIGVQVFASYRVFADIVKWLCLTLFAYVVSAFVVGVNWVDAIKHTFLPEMQFNKFWMATFVGFLGTTITPYLFVWQAALGSRRGRASAGQTTVEERVKVRREVRTSAKCGADVVTGMLYSNGDRVVHRIDQRNHAFPPSRHDQQCADAASTAPARWPLGRAVFRGRRGRCGIASRVPVLAGSSAFAMAEAFDWTGNA